MKWIESSKQSPKEGDLYFVKIRLTGSGLETFPGTCNYYNEWQASDDYEVVEWLDESPQTNTLPSQIDGSLEQPFTEDLQDQVRAHIRKDKLYDWSEAMTDNEMTYLENLLLTFNPLCPPGSIGYEEQVRHIAKRRGANSSQHGGDAVAFAEFLLKNSMRPNGFGGWGGGEINVNYRGSSSKQLYDYFKSQSTPTPPGIVDKEIPIELQMKEGRIFYIEDTKEWVSQYNNKQISISKFTELLNKRAYSRGIPLNNDIVGKLRAANPWCEDKGAQNRNLLRSGVWNKCCDTLAVLLSVGEKGEEKKEDVDMGKGECVKCKQKFATKDYNGHGHYVCENCYDHLSDEFDEEYK